MSVRGAYLEGLLHFRLKIHTAENKERIILWLYSLATYSINIAAKLLKERIRRRSCFTLGPIKSPLVGFSQSACGL